MGFYIIKLFKISSILTGYFILKYSWELRKAALVASDSGAPSGAMLVRPQGHDKNKQNK